MAGGRASPRLARLVRVGDLLQVEGPFGFLTWTEADGGPVGLIGAGSGVAPLASIVRYAAARGVRTPMTMLCASRDRGSAFLDLPLTALARREQWFDLVRTFTRSPDDEAARYHRRIDPEMLVEVLGARGDFRSWRHYVAGPPAMVSAVRAMLAHLGVDGDRICSEDHA